MTVKCGPRADRKLYLSWERVCLHNLHACKAYNLIQVCLVTLLHAPWVFLLGLFFPSFFLEEKGFMGLSVVVVCGAHEPSTRQKEKRSLQMSSKMRLIKWDISTWMQVLTGYPKVATCPTATGRFGCQTQARTFLDESVKQDTRSVFYPQ
jgi:hypothetical protein